MNIKSVLSDSGRAIILVPQGSWNFGSLDEVLGHKRRYAHEELYRLAECCDLEIQTCLEFNRLGTVAWFLNGRVLRRRSFGLGQIWLLNLIAPLIRSIDRFLPFPPLSLIAVMRRRSAGSSAGRAPAARPQAADDC